MSGQPSGAARLALPVGGDPTWPLLFWLFALIGYLAALCGLALVLLGGEMREWNRSLGNSLTLQIPAETSAARLETVSALLRQTAGIRGVRLLEPAETARLLEPWLGSAAALDTLPVPRLIDLQIDPGTAIDFADLRQKLSSIVPGAQLDDHRQWLGDFRGAAIRLASLIAAGIAAIALLAVVLTVSLTRTSLALHDETIELLHLIGAEDADVARLFQADALRLGLLGGATGAAAALVTVIAVGSAVPLHMMTGASGFADWRLWAVAIIAALAAGLVAMAGARITALRRLALMP
jgi:cell division transport system permease protein